MRNVHRTPSMVQLTCRAMPRRCASSLFRHRAALPFPRSEKTRLGPRWFGGIMRRRVLVDNAIAATPAIAHECVEPLACGFAFRTPVIRSFVGRRRGTQEPNGLGLGPLNEPSQSLREYVGPRFGLSFRCGVAFSNRGFQRHNCCARTAPGAHSAAFKPT